MPMNKEMETFHAISKLTAQGHKISFADDCGEGSMTVILEKDGKADHTHVGFPGASSIELFDSIYDLFVNGRGLSFAIPCARPTES